MKRTRRNPNSALGTLEDSRPKERRKARSAVVATLVGLVLVAGVLGAIYLIYTTAVTGESSDGGLAEVVVDEGDTLAVVADKLSEAGVVESATAFKLEARLGGGDTQIKPGEYTFEPGADAGEIMARLTSNKPPPTFALTLPEGLMIEQAAKSVSKQSDIGADQFEAAARKVDYGYAFLDNKKIETTEGYLFPKKYEFEEGTNASQVVNRLLEQYLIETQNLDLSGGQEGLKLSEHELVIVASLIEREAANDEERPLVASAIYNRLKKDMPLQIDATIQYARGKPKERLSLKDLEIKSPYNTYRNSDSGLPPGPISSPSLASLKAAVEPAETDYVYYVLKKDGKEHLFTKDYDEFLEAKKKAGL